jgi:hypothetical protein
MRKGNARAVKNLLGVLACRPGNALQDGNGCAQMRGRIIKKFHHERVLLEHSLDDAPLHTHATAVDEPDFGEPGGVRFV